jgi:NTP pyrophosphatase (non-canonical NTP hydrolase)
MEDTLDELGKQAKILVQKAGWEIYHTPENLVLFLVGEAAELGEYSQWLTEEKIDELNLTVPLLDELADVIKNVIYLHNVLPLPPLDKLIFRKIEFDEIEYEPKEFEGKSRYEMRLKERRKGIIPEIGELNDLQSLSFIELQEKCWSFVIKRNWELFYNPASLALAISVKAGEIATCFQRRPKPLEQPFDRVAWAMADVLINCFRYSSIFRCENLFQRIADKFAEDTSRFSKEKNKHELRHK